MKAFGVIWMNCFLLGMHQLVVAAQSDCPLLSVPECQCTSSFNRYYYMRCEDYTARSIPQFSASNRTFTSLTFRRSSIGVVEQDAFVGVRLQVLNLNSLGIQDVSSQAFSGLGATLQELYLDSNNISVLPGSCFHIVSFRTESHCFVFK